MKEGNVYVLIGAVILILAAVPLVLTLGALKRARQTARQAVDEYVQEEVARIVEASAAKDPSAGPETWLPDAGKMPEATLRAYYYYKDRGLSSELRKIVAQNSLDFVPEEDGEGMSERVQEGRGIVVDHAVLGENEATLYYRSWFSNAARLQGGRPYIGRLLKEEGTWKMDIITTAQLTLANKKGRTQFGFYDGTEEWWKQD